MISWPIMPSFDFLANHAKFCVKMIHEFAKAFEFYDMNLDTAL